MFPQWALLDHLGALIVSVFIFRAGVLIAWPAFQELIDAGASARELGRIQEIAFATPGVRDVHAIRTRRSGEALQVDLHVLVDGDLTVREGHRIAEEVQARLLSDGPRLSDVVVHIEPCEEEGA